MQVGDTVTVKKDCIFGVLKGETVLITSVRQYTILILTKNGGKHCLFRDEVEEFDETLR